MYNHHYNIRLKEYARELRTATVSKAEKRLWKASLRKKQLGIRVLRQRSIDHYIVDFFCPELKLIIEIDGNSHFTKGDYDRRRQNRLESLGYTMIRFTEGEVINQLDSVVSSLQHAIYCLKDEDGL